MKLINHRANSFARSQRKCEQDYSQSTILPATKLRFVRTFLERVIRINSFATVVNFDRPRESLMADKLDETIEHSSNKSRLTSPAETIAAPAQQHRSDQPTQIGSYSIVCEIARGGMGIVYRATDKRLKRDAAIKVIRAGTSSPEDSRRFLIEAQASAQLDHTNIVPVFESGEFEGQHFIALAFVDGSNLWAQIANRPMRDREAAMLFIDICDAIQYAHSKGIIHRDLKPQNILITQDGKPRVTDFGLAKSTHSDSSLTREGTVMGTPSYMPPEQALGQVERVNEQSDIYSIGATLYAALTTRPPFQAANPIETIRQVVESEPISPSALNVNVAKDLETICLKALQKEPSRRYASAGEMQADLQRFIRGEPILARRSSSIEKAWRWCRRNRLASSAIAAATTVLLGTAAISTLAYLRERELTQQKENLLQEKQKLAEAETLQRRKAEASATEARSAESKAQDRLQRARIINGDRYMGAKETGRALAWHLHAWRNSSQTAEDQIHRMRVLHDLFSSKVELIGLAVFDSPVVHASVSSRRDQVAIVTTRKQLSLRKCGRLHEPGLVLTFADPVIKTVWSSDDRYMATLTQNGLVQVWDPATGKLLHDRRLGKGFGLGLAFHPQTHDLTVCDEAGKLVMIAPATGQSQPAIAIGSLPIYDLAWRPDGRQLATIDTKQRTELWNWDSKVRLWPKPEVALADGFDDELSRYMPLFSRDGKVLLMRDAASPNCSNGIALRTDDLSIIVSFPLGRVFAAYSHWSFDDQSKLACYSYGSHTKILDLQSGKEKHFLSHPRESNSGSLSPDGSRLVTTSTSGLLHVWNTVNGEPECDGPRHAHTCDSLAFINDSDEVLVGSLDGTVRLWKIHSQEYVPPRRKSPNSQLVTMDGRYSRDGSRHIQLTDTDYGRGFLVRNSVDGTVILGPIERPHPNRSTWGRSFQQEVINAPRLSPSGKLAAFAIASSGTVAVWDVDAGKCVFAKPQMFLGTLRTLGFSEDETLLITSCSDNTARTWSAKDGAPVSPVIPVGFASVVQLSRDKQRLACIDLEREPYRLQLFDAKTGDRIVELPPVVARDRRGYEDEKGFWLARPTDSGVELWLGHYSNEQLQTARGQYRPIFQYDLTTLACDITLIADIAKLCSGYRIEESESLAYLSPFEFLDNADRYQTAWQQWWRIRNGE